MKWLRAWIRRLRGVFRPGDREHEVAEELESHLQLHIDDNLQRGMPSEEARRQAFISLGMERTKQTYRERSTIPVIENFLRDVRFGLRSLSKSLGYALIVVLSLALGSAGRVGQSAAPICETKSAAIPT